MSSASLKVDIPIASNHNFRLPSHTYQKLHTHLMRPKKKTPPERGRDPYPTVRKSVWIPGILALVLIQRWTEFFYTSFSPFALELICYDLRKRRTHPITGTIAHLSAQVQEEVDRKIVQCYRPGSPEPDGALIRFMCGHALAPRTDVARGSLAGEQFRLRIPEEIWPCVKIRIKELGYDSFSAYLTGLIRFDLMWSGPHKAYTGKDMDINLLRQLNTMTVQAFHSRPLQKTRVDYEVERMAGKVMTPEEREAETLQITERFVQSARRAG